MSSLTSTSSDDSLFGSSKSSHNGDPSPRRTDIGLVSCCIEGNLPPGLYVFPKLLPVEIAQTVRREIIKSDVFRSGTLNQAMLFTSADSSSSLPSYLQEFSQQLETLLKDHLTQTIWRLVFDATYRTESAEEPISDQDNEPLARQIILNLYKPGEGITPHVDLPHRYADGILGVSLGWGEGVVMDFEMIAGDERENDHSTGVHTNVEFAEEKKVKHSIWLPNGSIYILTGESRWNYTHGIIGRTYDDLLVPNPRAQSINRMETPSTQWERIERDIRISVTFRWLRAGRNVLSVMAGEEEGGR